MVRFKILVLISITLLFNSCSERHVTKSTSPKADYDVVIVGGGFSGLLAANILRKKNILVLEKEKNPGGRCLSGKWNDFHYPKGTEYLGVPGSNLSKLFKSLGIVSEPIPAPTDGILYDGKLYTRERLLNYMNKGEKAQYYRLIDELETLSESGIEDVIFDEQENIKDYKSLDNVSVKAWLQKKGYAEVIQKFIDVENRGLFGTDNANYSMLFNIPEMAYNMPIVETINKSEVHSFSHGMYSIIKAFCSRLGNKLKTGANVVDATVDGNNNVRITYTKDGKDYIVTAKSAIIATPASIASNILNGYISQDVRDVLKNIKYSKYATINFFTKKRFLHETWSVSCIDEDDVVTLYDVIRPQVSAEYRGNSILSVYMAPEQAYDTDFTKRSDKELLSSAYKTLHKIYPDFKENVLGYDITRFEYAFPVFSPNYGKNIETLINDNTLNGPIFLAGDYMVYATVDGALLSGANAAKKVYDYLK